MSSTTYPESAALIGAARSVWNGSTVLVKIQIEPSDHLAEEMLRHEIGPLDYVFITDSDIRHIKRSHADDLSIRGQPNVEPEDFGLLPEVLNTFDSCEHVDTDKLGNKKFLLTKMVGKTYYVVTIQRGKRRLEIKTMWKRPGASC